MRKQNCTDARETRGAQIKMKGMKHSAICRTCKKEFRSRIAGKIYCSMSCYMKDPEAKERLRKQSRKALIASLQKKGYSSADRVKTNCAHCHAELIIKPSGLKKRNFCNHTHYRLYQAARFDRWIASPQEIALPQNYDEFLTQDILPCIVSGCDWRGIRLANHVNLEHGITARQFKEMAGFNVGSGLVPPDESARMREAALIRVLDGRCVLPEYVGLQKNNPSRPPASLEAKEHISKAQALIRSETVQVSETERCKSCNGPMPEIPFGRKLYCSIKCRDEFYRNKRFDLMCFHCGNQFWGKRQQRFRNASGLPVFCSPSCRCAHNIAMTPNHKKHAEKMAAMGGV